MSFVLFLCLTTGLAHSLAPHNLQYSTFLLPLTSLKHLLFVCSLLHFVYMHVATVWDTHSTRTVNMTLLLFFFFLYFFIYFCLVWTLLLIHWRCGRLLWHLITFRHTPTHTHTRYDSSVRVISSFQRPLPNENTTATRHRNPYPRRDSKPQFSQASCLRPHSLDARGHVISIVILRYFWLSAIRNSQATR